MSKLGLARMGHIDYDLAIHKKVVGSGINKLRSKTFAQPKALKYGDVLITGETVISVSEGGNGIIFIELEEESRDGRKHRVQFGIPSRLTLALKPNRKSK